MKNGYSRILERAWRAKPNDMSSNWRSRLTTNKQQLSRQFYIMSFSFYVDALSDCFGSCLGGLGGSSQVKINGRNLKTLRLLGEVSPLSTRSVPFSTCSNIHST